MGGKQRSGKMVVAPRLCTNGLVPEPIQIGLEEKQSSQGRTRESELDQIWRMTTVEEMASFVRLWDLVQQVELTQQEELIN